MSTPTRTRPAPPQPSNRRRWTWGWVALSSVAIAAYFTQQYAHGTLDALAGRHVGLASAYADQPWAVRLAFYVHVVSAGLALLIGPFQFAARLRNRYRRAHRAVGRVYLVSVAIGAVTGLVMSFFNSLGLLILVQLPFAAPGTFEQVLADAYAPVAYLAWIPNLVVAELYLRARKLPALRLGT